ncbi:hypothetical protein [Bacillus suaedaesalsae]|uniref:Uncharacterized protein n=1 Tax=Bacillus suaedaesalsae TaxID=2810349 RepID=A0ABS2DL16_9BACI|nr:hypothetical protein [Bacillus suaedaesalsae]MBM6619191.1 hypothetical protein [Bacillus suaedaesalsae]
MKHFFSRYSHWLALVIIGFNFFSMFINRKTTTPDIIAVIFGAIGLVGIAFLAYYVEKQIRKKSNENKGR